MSQRYHRSGYHALTDSYRKLIDQLEQDHKKSDGSVLAKWLVGNEGALLPTLEPVWLSIERTALDLAGADAAIGQLAQYDGWLRRRSGLFRTFTGRHDNFVGTSAAYGPPLVGEWAAEGCGRSLAFERGVWVLRSFSELLSLEISPRLDVATLPALAQTVTTTGLPLVTMDDGQLPVRMHYRIYWGVDADDPSAIRRLCAAFAGFAREEEFAS